MRQITESILKWQKSLDWLKMTKLYLNYSKSKWNDLQLPRWLKKTLNYLNHKKRLWTTEKTCDGLECLELTENDKKNLLWQTMTNRPAIQAVKSLRMLLKTYSDKASCSKIRSIRKKSRPNWVIVACSVLQFHTQMQKYIVIYLHNSIIMYSWASLDRIPRDWVRLCFVVKLCYCQISNNYKISYGTVGLMPYRRACHFSSSAPL